MSKTELRNNISHFFTDKEANLKKDINSLLSTCNEKKLKSIYNIIIALQD